MFGTAKGSFSQRLLYRVISTQPLLAIIMLTMLTPWARMTLGPITDAQGWAMSTQPDPVELVVISTTQ